MVLIGGNKYLFKKFNNFIFYYSEATKNVVLRQLSYFSLFFVGPGFEIWDPQWKNSGYEIKIPNTQHSLCWVHIHESICLFIQAYEPVSLSSYWDSQSINFP
jgi:hypothetical protein